MQHSRKLYLDRLQQRNFYVVQFSTYKFIHRCSIVGIAAWIIFLYRSLSDFFTFSSACSLYSVQCPLINRVHQYLLLTCLSVYNRIESMRSNQYYGEKLVKLMNRRAWHSSNRTRTHTSCTTADFLAWLCYFFPLILTRSSLFYIDRAEKTDTNVNSIRTRYKMRRGVDM